MTCTPDTHQAIKLDEAAWSQLDLVGEMHVDADATGPAETLEARNCDLCHSTLFRTKEPQP